MKASWDDDIPNIWKNKKCSKPPNPLEPSDNMILESRQTKETPQFLIMRLVHSGCLRL